MATLIPCTVDTAPMAAEINSVSNHVMGTTAAVVTMQSAVIAAENKGANKVCANVNRGFFTLMRSQISQKIASKQSRVEALMIQMSQQKRMLLGIKTNMEREYGRIAERYLKIFTGINKELERRVREIDQPVFDLVNKHMVTSSNRMNSLSGWVATSQSEGLSQSQRIVVSNMKRNAQLALEQSTDFLSQIGEQRVLTEKVLIANSQNRGDRACLMPVMICETSNDAIGNTRTEIALPESLTRENKTSINNSIRESQDLEWKDENVSPMVTEEFCRLVDEAQTTTRVKDMISKMYNASEFQTL